MNCVGVLAKNAIPAAATHTTRLITITALLPIRSARYPNTSAPPNATNCTMSNMTIICWVVMPSCSVPNVPDMAITVSTPSL